MFAQSVQLGGLPVHTKKSPLGARNAAALLVQSLCCVHAEAPPERWQLPFTHTRLFGHLIFAWSLHAVHTPVVRSQIGVGLEQLLPVHLASTHWPAMHDWLLGQSEPFLHATQLGFTHNGVLGVFAQSESPLQPVVGLLTHT